MKVLQLGKFYPIRGGVEKVMWDLTSGLSARGIDCDMLCAELEKDEIIHLNEHGRVICVKAWMKKAATMIAPKMVSWLRKHKDEYDIIHVHHPDPMACLALRLSGYKGRVILHRRPSSNSTRPCSAGSSAGRTPSSARHRCT